MAVRIELQSSRVQHCVFEYGSWHKSTSLTHTLHDVSDIVNITPYENTGPGTV